jgi:asparagine synthase (glutamine-hydrolysing)
MSTNPVKTFSIGFAEEDFCELPYARQVAEHYKTEHHELLVRPDAIELLPVLARQFDEPFGDASAIPTYYVSQLAREHVTVALSGDGGDEAFAGYKRYAETSGVMRLQRHIAFLPLALRRVIFRSLANSLPEHMHGQGTLRRLGMSSYETYMHVTYYHPQDFLCGLLHADVRAALYHQEHSDPFASYFHAVSARDALTCMQYLDTKTYLPEDILTKVDRTSMLHSLEARVPLLDHKLLEAAARIPARLKLSQGEGKYIFKRFLHDLLPPNLLTRRKMGFGVPLVHWFRNDLTAYTHDLLLSRRSLERGLFNRSYIERLLAEHQQGVVDRSAAIWRLLVFEHWCQHYLDTAVVSVFSGASKVGLQHDSAML